MLLQQSFQLKVELVLELIRQYIHPQLELQQQRYLWDLALLIVSHLQLETKILVEGVSVGVGSTGKGFNSSAYDYKLFPIIAVDKNLGGIGATVAYSLEGLVDTDRGEFVGKFDSFNSGGRLIPEKHFPLFDVSLKDNEFLQDEIVSSTKYFWYC